MIIQDISGVLGGGGTPPLVKPVRSGRPKNDPFFRSRPRYENPWSPIGGTGGGPPPGGGGGGPPPPAHPGLPRSGKIRGAAPPAARLRPLAQTRKQTEEKIKK